MTIETSRRLAARLLRRGGVEEGDDHGHDQGDRRRDSQRSAPPGPSARNVTIRLISRPRTMTRRQSATPEGGGPCRPLSLAQARLRPVAARHQPAPACLGRGPVAGRAWRRRARAGVRAGSWPTRSSWAGLLDLCGRRVVPGRARRLGVVSRRIGGPGIIRRPIRLTGRLRTAPRPSSGKSGKLPGASVPAAGCPAGPAAAPPLSSDPGPRRPERTPPHPRSAANGPGSAPRITGGEGASVRLLAQVTRPALLTLAGCGLALLTLTGATGLLTLARANRLWWAEGAGVSARDPRG